MPLITDERTAVQILMREYGQREDEAGLNNFARVVLGAHAEQAKRLANMALSGKLPDLPPEDDVTVTRTIEGRELSITLKADRLPITSYQELVDFYEIDTDRWQPTQQTFNFWGSDAAPNFQVKAAFREVEYRGLTDADRQETRDWYAALDPGWEPVDPWVGESGNLLEIVVSDLHADKATAAGTTLEQHLHRVRVAVGAILERSEGFEEVALVFLGDTFDHEGNGMTTSGTPQAVQGTSRETYVRIRDFIGQMAVLCASVAPTTLYVLSGNHDRERSFYALDSLAGLLSKHENITVAPDASRAAIDWGVNLVGLWHGDRQKPVDIAMTLLREFDTRGKKVLEVHLGHEHTRREDELHGVLLRRFRTPTPDNEWATEKLFNHNTKSITGILWNKDRGVIAEYPFTFVGES